MPIILRTAPRDVRVTWSRPGGNPVPPHNPARDLAQALLHRFARRPGLMPGSERTLRQFPPAVRLQPLHQHMRIELAPRLALTVRPVRRTEVLERQIEARLAWQPGAGPDRPSPVEQIIRRVASRTERQSPQRLGDRGAPTSESRTLFERDARPLQPDFEASAAAVRRPPPVFEALEFETSTAAVRRPPPVFEALERVVQRSRPASAAPADAPAIATPFTPPERPVWVAEDRPRPQPPLQNLDIKRLTDHVVEALDRRLIAARERTGGV